MRLVLPLLALALAGCVDQTKEVQIYRSVLDDRRAHPAAYVSGETLTLERALALANANNEELASQGETYLQTLIAKNRAFSSFLPTLSFQPNLTVEQAPKGSSGPSSAGAPSTNAAAVAASQGGYKQSGQVLYRIEAPVVGNLNLAYRDIPLFKAANLAVVQQRELLLDAQATLLLNVAQTYFQVVISTEQVTVLRHSLALQEARVRDLQGRYRVKLALPLDVSQAQANQAATRVQLSQAENDLRNARRMLALLVGVPAVDGPLVNDTALPQGLASMDDFVTQALAHRQDYLAAQAAMSAARYTVRAAVAEYYPSVSLDLAGYLYREDFADASKWNGILLANLPLFTAGQIRSDVRTAWSHFRQAALLESYLRRQITQTVQTAYDNLATSAAILEDLRREVESSQLAYNQAVQMERNGLAIPLDVLTAQDTLLSSQLQYASEAFNRTIFYLDLLRAAGELTPDTPSSLQWTQPPIAPLQPT